MTNANNEHIYRDLFKMLAFDMHFNAININLNILSGIQNFKFRTKKSADELIGIWNIGIFCQIVKFGS